MHFDSSHVGVEVSADQIPYTVFSKKEQNILLMVLNNFQKTRKGKKGKSELWKTRRLFNILMTELVEKISY